MAIVLINIGSNLGNRRLNISRAVRAIANLFGNFEVSHIVETPAQGYESANKFLNAAVMVQTEMEPLEALHALQEIEHRLSPLPHRNADGSYADRYIDIDIMAIDDLVTDTPELTVPHPRLAERFFYLKPLAEIAPGWRHPLTGLSAADMIDNLIMQAPDAN